MLVKSMLSWIFIFICVLAVAALIEYIIDNHRK